MLWTKCIDFVKPVAINVGPCELSSDKKRSSVGIKQKYKKGNKKGAYMHTYMYIYILVRVLWFCMICMESIRVKEVFLVVCTYLYIMDVHMYYVQLICVEYGRKSFVVS